MKKGRTVAKIVGIVAAAVLALMAVAALSALPQVLMLYRCPVDIDVQNDTDGAYIVSLVQGRRTNSVPVRPAVAGEHWRYGLTGSAFPFNRRNAAASRARATVRIQAEGGEILYEEELFFPGGGLFADDPDGGFVGSVGCLLVIGTDGTGAVTVTRTDRQTDNDTEVYMKNDATPLTAQAQERIMAELGQLTRRDAVRVHTARAERGSLALRASKVGGTPYWNPVEPYPRGADGRPLVLLAQLDMAQVPHLDGFPGQGLLQFFISTNDVYGLDFEDGAAGTGHRVVYHEHPDATVTGEAVRAFLSQNGIPTTETLTQDCLFPFDGAFSLRFERAESTLGPASADAFAKAVKEAAAAAGVALPEGDLPFPTDLFDGERLDRLWEGNTGNWIGGWPTFTQDDPRDADGRYHDGDYSTLLFQLDSDDDILWGDVGVANFFISPDALRRADFTDVLYTWDCG